MRIFGHVEPYLPGMTFETRGSLSSSGVHRPPQAGISGSQDEGADSIVLSGGYEDDEDHGAYLIYTGAGGRDPKTGVQITDQLLTRTNLALVKNQLEGLPVRVIRGALSRSPYAPSNGYRYDGLYYVESHWRERGVSGFYVWRFKLVQGLEDAKAILFTASNQGTPERKAMLQQRIVRSTEVARWVKEIHCHSCQVCGLVIQTRAGPYAEAAHIKPLGQPHSGPDISENILCLCPNHHVMFDTGGFSLRDDLSLIQLQGQLRRSPQHRIGLEYVRYHRDRYVESS